MFEVPKAVPQQAVKNLGDAFKRFFQAKSAYPRFKKKFVDDSFRADNGPGTFDVQGKWIRLPRIGWIRTREPLRFSGKLKRVVVSRTADRWFASVLVEMDTNQPDRENQAIGGVDLGVKALATLSDGTTFESPQGAGAEPEKGSGVSPKHTAGRRTGRITSASPRRGSPGCTGASPTSGPMRCTSSHPSLSGATASSASRT